MTFDRERLSRGPYVAIAAVQGLIVSFWILTLAIRPDIDTAIYGLLSLTALSLLILNLRLYRHGARRKRRRIRASTADVP